MICAVLLLSACAKPAAEPPEHVMEKAVLAARELESAAFAASFDMEGGDPGTMTQRVQGTLGGRMQGGGADLAFHLRLDISMRPAGEDTKDLSVQGDMTILGEDETYLRITSLQSDDPALSSPLTAGLLDQWFLLPSGGSGATRATATPDPRLLRMQTDVMRVTRDRGIVDHGDRDAYHYDVTLDEPKLLAFLEEVARQRGDVPPVNEWKAWLDATTFEGEAWIDAETFELLRLQWTVESTDAASPMTAHVGLHLTMHNQAEPISPPASSKPFPADMSQLLPLSMPGVSSDMPSELSPEMQEEILRNLLEGR
jgi:hypothetical protein